jgi:FKBP-type peptidyl-prolyl cis-trans isomerase
MSNLDLINQKKREALEKTLSEGAAFMATNAQKEGVITTEEGIQYLVLENGDGTNFPKLTDTITCHYHGTLINGNVFDSSVKRNQSISFPLNKLITGWQKIIPLMSVGSKWVLYLPAQYAYGNSATGSIPGGSTLIFEITLLGIN